MKIQRYLLPPIALFLLLFAGLTSLVTDQSVRQSNEKIHAIAEESRSPGSLTATFAHSPNIYFVDTENNIELHCRSACTVILPRITNRKLVEARIK